MDDLSLARRTASEKLQGDPLAAGTARELAEKIYRRVGDAKMHPSIAFRAANAIIDHRLSTTAVREVLDVIDRKCDRLNSRGAYFCACLKRLLLSAGVDWD